MIETQKQAQQQQTQRLLSGEDELFWQGLGDYWADVPLAVESPLILKFNHRDPTNQYHHDS